MVPRQKEVLIDIPLRKYPQILAHSVRRAFKPTRAVRRLLGGEDFDKALREASACQGVGTRNMPIERGGVELRQDVNAVDLRVDTVADRNVDQAILGAQGHRWFRAQLR